MKKSLIYTSVCGLALFAGSLTTVMINNASAETSHDSPTVALEQSLNTSNKIDSKNETIYVMTNSEGKASSIFINNALDSDSNSLPLELKVTYTLDGSETSAEDLIGKSGHVKINYAFSSTETSGSAKVPFLTVTSTILDGNKFKNVKINNGKVISENNNNVTLAGYAVVGLNENLGTDVLPADFTIEADVTEFEMSETYSLATDELFADFDTSKLNSLDDLISSMNQLESGLNQLIAGAGSLSSGLDSAVSGVMKLQSGAKELNSGASQLANGLTELSANNDSLNNGAAEIFSGILTTTASAINSNDNFKSLIVGYGQNYGITYPITLTSENYKTTLEQLTTFLNAINNMPTTDEGTKQILSASIESINSSLASLTKISTFVSGLKTYTDGVASASTGATELSTGTSEFKIGIDTLASGMTELSEGSKTLESGLAAFKTSGIDKLVNFANNDLNNALANVRASVSAAKDYHSYKNSSAESVKFVFKTPSLKK
jgi:putative membrane protein